MVTPTQQCKKNILFPQYFVCILFVFFPVTRNHQCSRRMYLSGDRQTVWEGKTYLHNCTDNDCGDRFTGLCPEYYLFCFLFKRLTVEVYSTSSPNTSRVCRTCMSLTAWLSSGETLVNVNTGDDTRTHTKVMPGLTVTVSSRCMCQRKQDEFG